MDQHFKILLALSIWTFQSAVAFECFNAVDTHTDMIFIDKQATISDNTSIVVDGRQNMGILGSKQFMIAAIRKPDKKTMCSSHCGCFHGYIGPIWALDDLWCSSGSE